MNYYLEKKARKKIPSIKSIVLMTYLKSGKF
ncbi:hypothetical protein J2T04_004211 [Chryseobacterium lathyri]|uniref:Uncharacterized protein n=1 Tax=Chryseobacterium lathyri TaxID=395933 RepID=A0ABT9SS56_9FLAO|nr:hypothetical protein [Chryseobacterium lathyri]MDQ0067171.1 hypothetical protein [Chryseobacterium lathyri]